MLQAVISIHYHVDFQVCGTGEQRTAVLSSPIAIRDLLSDYPSGIFILSSRKVGSLGTKPVAARPEQSTAISTEQVA